MAYNTKSIIVDKDGNPISQYYNPTTDSYEPVEGSGGGNKVVLYNEDGTENNSLSLIPILDKLGQLTGTIIDEETRKSNELSRIAFYELLQQKLADGDFIGAKGDTGLGLEFNWNGTQLGVRVEGDLDYIYVDLKGEKGDKGDKGDTGNIENLNSTHIIDALGYTPADDIKIGPLASLLTIVKTSIVNAINSLKGEVDAHKAEFTKLGFRKPYTVPYNALFIDEVNGNDANDGLTQVTAIKTPVRINSLLPQVINSDFTIYIVGNFNNTLYITNFIGTYLSATERKLIIKGVTDVASNHKITGLRMMNCSGLIELKGLDIGSNIASASRCAGVSFLKCISDLNISTGIIQAVSSNVEVIDCNLNNSFGYSILSTSGGNILSRNNIGESQYGLYAFYGGVISKSGTQPTGTIANERVSEGGVIR